MVRGLGGKHLSLPGSGATSAAVSEQLAEVHVSGSSYTETVFCSSCQTEIVESHLAEDGQNQNMQRLPKQMF